MGGSLMAHASRLSLRGSGGSYTMTVDVDGGVRSASIALASGETEMPVMLSGREINVSGQTIQEAEIDAIDLWVRPLRVRQ